MYYIAEEVALVEGMDYNCVTLDQFEKFVTLYHNFDDLIGRR